MTRAKAIEIIKAIRTYARMGEFEALSMAIEALEHPYGKHGEWIDDKPGIPEWKKSTRPWRCSVCGYRTGTNKLWIYDFCPKCGSDMRQKEGESE